MSKPRGLSSDPLDRVARANAALGLDDELPPPARPVAVPPPAAPAEPHEDEPEDDAVADDELGADSEPTPPAARRRTKPRTGTFGNPYVRRDDKQMVKCSFNASIEFFQELRRFEAELPPKSRNAWIESALRKQMARDRKRWAEARETRAAKGEE